MKWGRKRLFGYITMVIFVVIICDHVSEGCYGKVGYSRLEFEDRYFATSCLHIAWASIFACWLALSIKKKSSWLGYVSK